MSTVAFRRSARRPAPSIPTGDIVVPAPAPIASGGRSRWTHGLMAVPMLAGTVATALLFAGRQGGAYSYVVGAVFGLSSLGMLATSMTAGAGRRERVDVAGARRDYAAKLATVRQHVRATVTEQRIAMYYRHPAPSVLVTLVDSGRLWERRRGDADFGAVRVGLGPQALTTSLIPEPGTTDDLDPIGLAAMRRLIAVYGVVPSLPVAITTTGFARISIDDAGLVRALLAQLAFAHAPADQLIAVCSAPDRAADWEFLKWLPHHLHPDRRDAAGPMRLYAPRLGDLETLLGTVLEPGSDRERRLVVVIDGGDPTGARRLTAPSGIAGCCVIDIGTDPADVSLTVGPGGRLLADGADMGVPDTLSIVEATALARALAPFRLAETRADGVAGSNAVTTDGLLGVGDASGDLRSAIAGLRAARTATDRLRVAIGRDPTGHPVLLDLKEAARAGMGPHGLVIGATGSGKSELLRTLVLGLAAGHDSQELNFVLIDFKGGATFAAFDRLPHTAAVITNLADELPLVDRMTDALNGELVRRQEVLRRAGNLASLHDYEQARRIDPTLDPLPVLLIICDEFSELLSAKPDFIDLFVAIGRLGRSLGVHLLLASQRLDEGRLRGLEGHLSYRVGLRTFSAMESRSVLGVPDAYELPRSPGHGFVKAGTEALVRFTAAYSSGPVHRVAVPPMPVRTAAAAPWEIVAYTNAPVRSSLPASADAVPAAAAAETAPRPVPSLLDAMTEAMADVGVPAHRVWLPPLSTSDSLDSLLGPLEHDPARGLSVTDRRLHGRLRVPVATVDRPFEQRREPLWLSLDAAAGHVGIVGGPQSGKSSLLRALICAIALTHMPREATFYCLDFGGGSLATLRDLPHVGGVSGRLATDAVQRTVAEVATLIAARERQFATQDLDSIDEARRRGALGRHGDVFLVVDGWATARSDYEDIESTITDIAIRGLSYGVHVIITATRWADLRPALRDLLGSRLELRLGDASDSQISRKAAGTVPAGAPGRGITLDQRHFLAAAPRLAAGSPRDLIKAIAAGWPGPTAPAVRELPALVPYAQVAAADVDGLAVPIGIAEADLQPVAVDFSADPHLLVFGEPGSGKSSVLRAIAGAIVARYPPERVRIVVVDYRRSMLGDIDGEHLIGYATADGPATTLLGSVGEYMQQRLPGPDVTPRELRARSWWSGPECFVLVDDYDLVAAAANPLAALLGYLSQATDIGLHVIVARRSGGAARAMFEPVLARLRELATPGLVLSGDRDEGALIGTVRPRPLPPGRATLVTRRDGARLVQIGYLPPIAAG